MKHFLCILPLFFFAASLHAQIEKVIVETYYISDANDATDTIGGKLEAGSTTYRIYIDLAAGAKLKKIYGDANHLLILHSDSIFFNNIDRGVSFGKDLNSTRLDENTVALDTWLTLGQATKNATKTYFGILKAEDTDGSIVGGINNDGGSAAISGGLLVNAHSAAGIALTTADGLDTMMTLPTSWSDYGILDVVSGEDSSIFGSHKKSSEFNSGGKVVFLTNSGVMGSTPDNKVLIAQLTTKGEISFELNVEILDSNGTTIKYVANNDTLLSGEKLSRYLKYPYAEICGCPDPNYVEYIKDRDCDVQDSCKTIIVYGCTDPLACNYDPGATFNIPELCCYSAEDCGNRDISIVCPTLSVNESEASLGFHLFPNPVQDELAVQIFSLSNKEMSYVIYDSFGRQVSEKNLGVVSVNGIQQVDVSGLASGLYLFRLSAAGTSSSRLFIKN